MADISKITLPSGNTYDLKDATARDLIAALEGSTAFLGETTTALADGSTTNPVQINSTAITAKNGNIVIYGSAEFIWDGTKWIEFGDLSALSVSTTSTQVLGSGASAALSSGTVTFGALTNKTDKVLGEATTFTNAASAVSFANGTTDSVLGSDTTFALSSGSVSFGALTGKTVDVIPEDASFTVTNPTISVTPTSTYIKAVASGAAVAGNGTASAITGFGTHSTITVPTGIQSSTSKLVTTTVPNVTANTAVTIPNVTGNTSVNFNDYTFTVTGETLSIAATAKTASNTTLGTALSASRVTLGTEKTVATGSLSSTGGGSTVVTEVSVEEEGTALAALGTPTTATVLTGVRMSAQPTITLSTESTAATGRVQVMTGASATASGTAVSYAPEESTTVLTGLPTASVGTAITKGTNDRVTVVTSIGTGTAAAQTITVGTNDKVDAVIAMPTASVGTGITLTKDLKSVVNSVTLNSGTDVGD